MTYDQFKFCCLVFCKYFEGKTYKNVITNGFPSFKNHIIKLTLDHFSIHNSHLTYSHG